MKTTKFVFYAPMSILLLLILLFDPSCKPSNDNDCEINKWENPLDHSLQPRLILGNVKFIHNDEIYDIKEAKEVFFSATIYKVHCDGSHSQHYDYFSSFDPRTLDDAALQNGVFVGYPITFTFEHDKDHLRFKYNIDATWEDNAKATTPGGDLIIEHNLILKDIDFLKEYFRLKADLTEQIWHFTGP